MLPQAVALPNPPSPAHWCQGAKPRSRRRAGAGEGAFPLPPLPSRYKTGRSGGVFLARVSRSSGLSSGSSEPACPAWHCCGVAGGTCRAAELRLPPLSPCRRQRAWTSTTGRTPGSVPSAASSASSASPRRGRCCGTLPAGTRRGGPTSARSAARPSKVMAGALRFCAALRNPAPLRAVAQHRGGDSAGPQPTGPRFPLQPWNSCASTSAGTRA